MTDAIPDVQVKKKGSFPIVWIIPIVAVLVGGWVWWQALQERGPTITISWQTADGLEAGKTLIKYREVEIGKVESIDLLDDLSGVRVTAMLRPDAEEYLTDRSRFWVVRPRIGAGGVSGLGTLVSGAYIGMDPRTDGAPTLDFVGLELPPVRESDAAGLKLTLVREDLGSISIGSQVSYHGLEAGLVERYRLDEKSDEVEIDIFIEPEYMHLVHGNTRFWNASGIEASLGAGGIELRTGSLETLISGGIAFGNLESHPKLAPAPSGTRFQLFDSRDEAQEIFTESYERVAYFNESVRGLQVGAPVEFRGMKLGVVTAVAVEVDPTDLSFRTPVHFEIQPERLSVAGVDFQQDEAQTLDAFISRGLRAQLATGSLVTGALYVDLVFDPESESVLVGDGSVPEIPSTPSTTRQISEALEELPIIVRDLMQTVEAVAEATTSPQARATVENVAAMSEDLRSILDNLERRAPQLIENVDAAIAAAVGTFTEAETALAELQTMVASDSSLRAQIGSSVNELSGALRSMRILADYLQRHPEALISGKGDG